MTTTTTTTTTTARSKSYGRQACTQRWKSQRRSHRLEAQTVRMSHQRQCAAFGYLTSLDVWRRAYFQLSRFAEITTRHSWLVVVVVVVAAA